MKKALILFFGIGMGGLGLNHSISAHDLALENMGCYYVPIDFTTVAHVATSVFLRDGNLDRLYTEPEGHFYEYFHGAPHFQESDVEGRFGIDKYVLGHNKIIYEFINDPDLESGAPRSTITYLFNPYPSPQNNSRSYLIDVICSPNLPLICQRYVGCY